MNIFIAIISLLSSHIQGREVIVKCGSDMNQCYSKAQRQCSKGFEIVELHVRTGYLRVVCK